MDKTKPVTIESWLTPEETMKLKKSLRGRQHTHFVIVWQTEPIPALIYYVDGRQIIIKEINMDITTGE